MTNDRKWRELRRGKWNIARKKEKRMRTEESRAIPLFISKNKFKEKETIAIENKNRKKNIFFLPFCRMPHGMGDFTRENNLSAV